MARSQAVRARVAAAENYHALPRRDRPRFHPIARNTPVLLRQKIHREMDAVEFAAGNPQIPRLLRARREQDCIELAPQLIRRDRAPDMCIRLEHHALRAHLIQPPVDQRFLHFEIRDPVAQQSPDPIAFLEHRYRVSRPGKLLRRRQTRWTRSDHRDRSPRSIRSRLRFNPSLVERVMDNRPLNALDRYRPRVNPQNAGRLARGRAHPPGKLRKVVGRMQRPNSIAPVASIDQIVPVGN